MTGIYYMSLVPHDWCVSISGKDAQMTSRIGRRLMKSWNMPWKRITTMNLNLVECTAINNPIRHGMRTSWTY